MQIQGMALSLCERGYREAERGRGWGWHVRARARARARAREPFGKYNDATVPPHPEPVP